VEEAEKKRFEQSLFDLIPERIRKRKTGKSVVHAGFRVGPSFIAGKDFEYAEPVTLEEACETLEKYRHLFRACRIEFTDHSVAWLYPTGFLRYELTDWRLKKKRPPMSRLLGELGKRSKKKGAEKTGGSEPEK